MSDYQCRPLRAVNDTGNGEGLATAGDTEQYLISRTIAKTPHQRVDSLWLVATGLIVRFKRERHNQQ